MRQFALGLCLSTGIVLAWGSAAFGAPVTEVETNDTFGTAQVLPADFLAGYGAGSIDGRLDNEDVDFYSVALNANELATISVFDFTPNDDLDNDSLLGIWTPSGTLFDTDDDDGPGFLSSYHFFPTVTGDWVFAVTGFGDDDFRGDHDEKFNYHIVVSQTPIPEPATMAMLALGAGMAVLPRRSR